MMQLIRVSSDRLLLLRWQLVDSWQLVRWSVDVRHLQLVIRFVLVLFVQKQPALLQVGFLVQVVFTVVCKVSRVVGNFELKFSGWLGCRLCWSVLPLCCLLGFKVSLVDFRCDRLLA